MPDGYEIRGKSVRVYFRYEGELCREKIGDNTPENIERAKRLAQIIKLEQESGTFDYGRHFPDSDRVRTNTFIHYADLFQEIRSNQVASATIRADMSKFRVHILPRWGETQMEDIDYIDLQQWISADLAALSNKTIKTIVNLISQVFDLYNTRTRGNYNPTKGIKIKLPDADDPDPFTLDEIRSIVDCPTDKIQERDLIEFMMWDGCRPSEAIALCWEDVIDLEQGIIRYRHARVDGKWKVTKTRRSTRVHKLIKPAREALIRQHRITFNMEPITADIRERDNRTVKPKKLRPVFRRKSGEPHFSDMALRDRFFSEHCEQAGVRYRPPSNCRHTFISQMLTLGVVPMHWISNHVGHTTIAMIQKHYGKWIQQDGSDMQQTIEKLLDL